MPILIVLALVPTLSFYVYVLVQFRAEAHRRRQHDTCTMIVPLHSVHARDEEYNLRRPNETGSQTTATPELAKVSAANLAEIEPPARAPDVATYPRNRVAAFQSGSGRLAVKRAAKG
jgi:hypothetical protein